MKSSIIDASFFSSHCSTTFFEILRAEAQSAAVFD